MKTKIEKEVRFLKIYAMVATVVCCGVLTMGFTSISKNQKFEEIDVERINIVEADGQLKMVISNKARQHPGIANGKIIERDGPRAPGLIFFNQKGDEMGGLIYGENGPDGHFGSLTWDKVGGDQTIGFRHLDGGEGTYESGIQMWQQPDISVDQMLAQRASVMKIKDEAERKAAYQELVDNNQLTQRRLFLGKNRSNASILEMLDMKGNSRLALMVEADGTPKLIFLDEEGKIILSIPEEDTGLLE